MPSDYVDIRVRAADLWHTGPRRPSKTWAVGDVLVVSTAGRPCRWVIRTLTATGDVELEQTNSGTGVWWRTTLDRLPPKGGRP